MWGIWLILRKLLASYWVIVAGILEIWINYLNNRGVGDVLEGILIVKFARFRFLYVFFDWLFWQVLVEEKLSARILTLNRPKQLNALSFQMVSCLTYFSIMCFSCTIIYIVLFSWNICMYVCMCIRFPLCFSACVYAFICCWLHYFIWEDLVYDSKTAFTNVPSSLKSSHNYSFRVFILFRIINDVPLELNLLNTPTRVLPVEAFTLLINRKNIPHSCTF